jgi:hypothetical protein
MAPEHNFFFWNNPANSEVIPPNFRRDLAILAFREGRKYERLKMQEKQSRKKKAASICHNSQ